MVRLLIVEDDNEIVGPISRALHSQGYEVTHVPDGLRALAKIKHNPPDLLLLDLNLPGLDGFSVCENVRKSGFEFPIVMMTGRSDARDLVHGFDCGANDFLRKPFNRSELFARLKAVTRSSSLAPLPELNYGLIKLDQNSRLCTVSGELVSLTTTEFDLLAYLMRNQGKALKRNLIIHEIWETNWLGPTKNLDMHISALRRKLGPAAIQLQTVRGLGFRFDEL
jgi:DNA-binding response OmpR family regulator